MPPARTARPARRLLPLAVLPALVVLALPAAEAEAQECLPLAPANGGTVTCTGSDTDGFASAATDLTVTVESGADVTPIGPGVDGLQLSTGNTVTVESGASITVNGAGADGIQAGDDQVDITNQGTITVNGNGAGINVGDDSVVTNAGSIQLGANGARGIVAGDDTGGAPGNMAITNSGGILNTGGNFDNLIGIQTGNGIIGDTTEVTNSGTITLNGAMPGVNTIGIDVGDNNDVVNSNQISVTNDNNAPNTIGVRMGAGNMLTNTASGRITASGQGARGVVVTGNGNTITNQGTITSRSVDLMNAPGAAVDLSGGANNTLINEGFITGFGADNVMPGTAVLGGGGVEMIEHRSGEIVGNVDLMGGDDDFHFFTGAAFQGNIDGGAGTDDFFLRGTGLGSLELDSILNFNTLEVQDGGIWGFSGTGNFPGGVTITAGEVQTAGAVTLTNTPLTIGPGGTLTSVIDSSAGTAGSYTVTGAVAVNLGGTLRIRRVVPLQSGTFTILSAPGMGFGGTTFATTPADTALLDFTLLQTANTITVDIVRRSHALLAETPNQRAVGRYLDLLLASNQLSAGLNDFLLSLEPLSASQISTILGQLHGEAYDAHTGQMAQLGRAFARVATEPRPWCKPSLYGLRPAQRDEVPCGPRGWSAWMRALAGFGDRDTGSDFLESDVTQQGLLGGIDWRPSRHWLVTSWLGISSTDIDVEDAGEGDLDTIEVGMAAVFRMAGARARAAFGYGRGDHMHDRELDFAAATAESEFSSNRIYSLFEFGWVFSPGNWRLEPLASLDVTWIQEEDISEQNATALRLAVDERENTLVATNFGGRISYRHFQNPFSDRGPGFAQGTWTPEVSVRWRSLWTGADREIESRLREAPVGIGKFTTEAEDSEQGAEIGAHLTFQPHGSTGAVSIGYDGYIGDGGMIHNFGAKLRLFF